MKLGIFFQIEQRLHTYNSCSRCSICRELISVFFSMDNVGESLEDNVQVEDE